MLSASGGLLREIAEFLWEPRLAAKDLPWQAQLVNEEIFRQGFQERQHTSLLVSSTVSFIQLTKAPSTLSPASFSDICNVLAISCNAFGATLLLTVRLAIDSAVTACLTLW